ncbi:MAG: hypothetical protein AABX05_03205 [Nanoarchaeota archaeon]
MKPIPASVTVITGDQHLVQPTIDDFFRDIVDDIKKNYNLKQGPDPFRIDSGEVAYSNGQITDNRVTYLCFCQETIAVVMEMRTDFNHVCYNFFRNLEGLESLVATYNGCIKE